MTSTTHAIRAWVRLDAAFTAVNARLRRDFGVTGAQLAMLRLIDEFGGTLSLAELRSRLSLHPATCGQMVDRLAAKLLVDLTDDPADRRRRVISITAAGAQILRTAPLVGPVRLRHESVDPADLTLIATGLDAALVAFGLSDYV